MMDDFGQRGLPDDQTYMARWQHLMPEDQRRHGIGPQAYQDRIDQLRGTPGAGISDYIVDLLTAVGQLNPGSEALLRKRVGEDPDSYYPAKTKNRKRESAIAEAMRMEKEGYKPESPDLSPGMTKMYGMSAPRSRSEMEAIDAYLRRVLGK